MVFRLTPLLPVFSIGRLCSILPPAQSYFRRSYVHSLARTKVRKAPRRQRTLGRDLRLNRTESRSQHRSFRRLLPTSIGKRIPKTFRQRTRGNYRAFHNLTSDYANWLLRRRGELTPPWHLFRTAGVGGEVSSFSAAGRRVFENLIEIGELKPDESILEVGCGIGRTAVPLTRFLDKGTYEGFDIVPMSIGWCQHKITPKHPNFHFRLANVHNEGYNPNGKLSASEYRFPYGDGSFDFVFLVSVFTHMIPEDVEHYLSEISRVLRKGGRCLITYHLLNQESKRLLDSGSRDYELEDIRGPCTSMKLENPTEYANAYEEKYVKTIYLDTGLEIVEPVHYGWWVGRGGNLRFGQDIILARKK